MRRQDETGEAWDRLRALSGATVAYGLMVASAVTAISGWRTPAAVLAVAGSLTMLYASGGLIRLAGDAIGEILQRRLDEGTDA